jgi:nitroreductase
VIPTGPDVLAVMRRRVSTRSYTGRPVDLSLIEQLLQSIAMADHLTAVPPRVELISGVERTHRVLSFVVGSYGLVLNVPHLLAGVLPGESDAARVDLGYVLEQAVLEATRLDLGTCWVTGSYHPQSAGDAVDLAPGEVAAAVCALGRPSETRLGRFHSRTVRRLAGSRRRKPLTEIVFSERWGDAWAPERADTALVSVLDHARIAPSATNRQPWRFIVRPDGVALALIRPSPIDAGIVMAHFALASAALGRPGRWRVHLGDGALAQEWGLPEGVLPVGIFV